MTRQRPVKANEPSGLGGWLILPGLILIIAPLTMLYTLYTDFLPVFQDGIWQELTTPGTAVYHHLWAPVLILEVVVNLTFLASLVVLLFLFFKKSYRFPGLFIAYLLFRLVFLIADAILANQIPLLAELYAEGGLLEDLAPSAVFAAIWVPYFLRSRRVKNTFVVGRPDPALEEAKRHLEQAYSHEAADRLEAALSECELAIQLAPGFGEAHNLHGVILESLGRGAEAVEAYRKAVDLDPSLAEAWKNLREARAEYGEPTAPAQTDLGPSTVSSVPRVGATTEYGKVQVSGQTDSAISAAYSVSAASLASRAAVEREDAPAAPRPRAIAEYGESRAQQQTDAAAWAVPSGPEVSRAAFAAAEQAYAPAAPRPSAIPEALPKKKRLPRWSIVVPILLLVGLLAAWWVVERPFSTPESDPAVGEGTVAIEPSQPEKTSTPDPESAEAYLSRGDAYYDQGEYDQALFEYDQAIAIDPQFAKAYDGRGRAYNAKGFFDQAIAEYDQAITLDPQFVGAWVNRAGAHYNKRDYVRALPDFDKAIELDPSMAIAFFYRGVAHYELGEQEQAAADAQRALELGLSPELTQSAQELLTVLGRE